MPTQYYAGSVLMLKAIGNATKAMAAVRKTASAKSYGDSFNIGIAL